MNLVRSNIFRLHTCHFFRIRRGLTWNNNEYMQHSVNKKIIKKPLRAIKFRLRQIAMFTDTTFAVRSQIVTRRTRAYETPRGVVALAVIANALLRALVYVCKKLNGGKKKKHY